ncbi:MAG: hypothetical protein ABIK09_11365 [Pseudomonadota bacterium]
MIRELHGWFVALWRDHRVLALLLGALALRLLFHFDDYFTIRDADFFPAELGPAAEMGYRGGRVIPLLLNVLSGTLSGDDPLLAKLIVGKVLLLAALPGFLVLAIRSGLGVRSVGFGAALFLASAQLFGLYDTLGPYSLLMATCLWQVVFALDARDGRKGALVRYAVASGVALLCHRNGLVFTGLTLGVVFLGRRDLRMKTRELLTLLGLVPLAAWKIVQVIRFDAAERAHQAEIYGKGVLASVDWGAPDLFGSVGSGVLSLMPGWAGILWPPIPYLAVATLLLVAAAAHGARGVRRELRWLSLAGLCAAAGLAVVTEALAAELFFQPNHATYGFMWMPLLVLLLGGALAEGLPRWAGGAALALLVGLNLWQGHGFRSEAFDPREYEEFVASEGGGPDLPRRLVPGFLANEYACKFPGSASPCPAVQNERVHNDFTRVARSEFVIDLITYDELGIPLYRYDLYREHLEAWGAVRGLEVDCRKHVTFTSCHVGSAQASARTPGDGQEPR